MVSSFRRRRARELCAAFGKSYEEASRAWLNWKAAGGFIITTHMLAKPRRLRTSAEGQAFESFIFGWCEGRRHRTQKPVLRCHN